MYRNGRSVRLTGERMLSPEGRRRPRRRRDGSARAGSSAGARICVVAALRRVREGRACGIRAGRASIRAACPCPHFLGDRSCVPSGLQVLSQAADRSPGRPSPTCHDEYSSSEPTARAARAHLIQGDDRGAGSVLRPPGTTAPLGRERHGGSGAGPARSGLDTKGERRAQRVCTLAAHGGGAGRSSRTTGQGEAAAWLDRHRRIRGEDPRSPRPATCGASPRHWPQPAPERPETTRTLPLRPSPAREHPA